MTALEICVLCREPVPSAKGIDCYLCGGLFHYSNARECGVVLPNPSACCGMVYLCALCARKQGITSGDALSARQV